MKVRNIESGLAWIGALIVVVGVTFAASSALASEPVADRAIRSSNNDAAAMTLAGARHANMETAAEASAAIARATTLGLDIEIAGRTSTLIAGAE